MDSNLFRSVLLRAAAAIALSAAAAAAGSASAQGIVTLQAAPGTTTLPDGRTVPMWGYTCGDVLAASAPSTGATCSAAGGAPQNGITWQPPLITVPASASTNTASLTIRLVNHLPAALPTSIIIDGQVGGGLGSSRTTTPSPVHGLQGTTWPGTIGGIDPATSAVTLGAPGAGYNAPPVVTIANSNVHGGVGATAVAYVGNGAVTRVVVSNPGGGYSSADHLTVSIAPPPCSLNGSTCLQATATMDVSVLSSSDGSPTFVPPPQFDRVRSLASEVVNGSTGSLAWTSLRPGTYLLHSGTETSIQHTMGLYAILVVTDPAGPTSAYGAAIDKDVSLLLSEIDPEFNDAVSKAVGTSGFDPRAVWNGQPGQCGDATVQTCYPPIVNYSPLYYLINGTAFDRTNQAASIYAGPGSIATSGAVLLRFANAGLRMHVPSVVGSTMTLLAEDGNALHGPKRMQDSVLLMAGKTYDVTIAPVAANGAYAAAAYPVFDRQLSLSSGNTRDGGMQAYISVNGGAASGTVGSASLSTTAAATDRTYYCSAGQALSVSNPAIGLLAGSTGVSGVALGAMTGDLSIATLTLQSNGTFTYIPTAGSATCGGTFAFLPNGNATLARTVTIAQCDSTAQAATCALAAAPVAKNLQFVSNIATTYTSTPPGVLSGVANPGGLVLTASGAGVNADGSFSVAGPGAAGNCGAWDATQGALPSGATCVQVPFTVANAQGSSSSALATVAFQPGSGLLVNVVDAVDPTKAITDYRWIIEEDRTFWIDTKCQINSSNPALRPSTCPPLPVESLGYNFHTASMPVIAQGCVGTASCEDQQTVYDPASDSHVGAACDVGNGICRTGSGVTQKTPLLPGTVHLDPTKRYFISILPGDSVNPTIGGPGAQPLDPANPAGKQRQFDIGKDCGPYTGPTGAWEPAGAAAMCGHGMTGSQISKELLANANPTLTIKAQETPLPTAKISVLVFQDDNPLNGENDAGGGVDVIAPNEAGLGGFEIKLFDQAGQLGDNTGQITYDEFNQPVSNSLANTIDPITKLDSCPINARGDGLLGMIPTCPKYESDGKTLSPLAGQAVIANLYPGLYEVQAYPAADRIGRGEEWVQTNTLDGGKPHEAFIKPNEPGYFQEFGPGGFHITVGFANPAIINKRLAAYCGSAANGGGTGAQTCDKTLTVHVANNHMSRSPDQRTYSSESYDNYAFSNCYVSIGPADEADFAFAKCDANGTAVFKNIPNGTYKISVFDQWNDIMLDGLVGTVAVTGDTEKEFPVTQWRTNLYTRTFVDANGDGVSQDGSDPGLALVNTNIRYRDGSFAFFNNTDLNGYAAWNEVFPFMNWLVVETSATRYKSLGVHSVYDGGGPVDCSSQASVRCNPDGITAHLANSDVHIPLPNDLRIPGAVYCDDADCTTQNLGSEATTIAAAKGLSTGMISPPQAFGNTMAWQGLLGQNTFMEFPVKPFNPGENGGINGQVVYASTRPFDDPTLLLQLSWEPGVANVKVNLYSETVDASGNTKLQLVDTTMSASFDDWAQGFRRDANGNYIKAADGKSFVPNMNCPGQDSSSPFFATLKNSKMWLDAADADGSKKSLAYQSQFKCYDGWSQLNQAQPAPYDGKYSFPSVNTVGADGKPASSSCHMATDAEPWGCKVNKAASSGDWDYDKPVLLAGKYVVEVVVPQGYELVKEEDKNILLGDVYIAPVTQQFAGFGNVFIMPDQATINASYNQHNPGNLNLTGNLGSVTFPRHEGDTGSIEAYWPCVGAERIVPDLNSLYPQAGQAAPFAGARRRLCDRKEVQLDDQSSSLAKFYVFSSTHIAGHFTGTITNDFASEFDPFSPQFGEKFGPPNLPVGLRDFNGYEVARVYSDQWGIYNGLYYSTWTVNPPNPTGYAPEMSIACMNDPGPILAADGKTMITDPNYNPAYSNFCYEQPFMPGTTTYMDTPVIPTMSFADGYNLPDAEYPDGTPAVLQVKGDVAGPWVLAAGGNGGVVTTIAVNNGGAGYTGVPNVAINNAGSGGSGAAGTAVLSSGVASVSIATRGAQYVNVPTVNLAGGGGSGAAATAYLGVGSWISQLLPGGGIDITSGGAGSYTNNAVTPAVTFSAPSCANPAPASATCRTAMGTAGMAGNGVLRRVNAINMTELGRGYTAAPTIAFSSGNAKATATLGVTFVSVDAPGTGYANAPAVAFAGGGQPLLGTALASSTIAGSVVAINVTNGGTNYTSAPTVSLTGGGGSGATAAASISTTGALTITALGDKQVQNPNFSGPNSTGAPYNQKTITRHYGFGGGGTVALVGADGASHPLTGVIWGDMQITGNVPAGVPLCNASNKSYTGSNSTARCGQLVITRSDNGKQSIDAVTVTIGGTRPWIVTTTGVTNANGAAVGDNGAVFGRMGLSPIQLAIDQANPGDLLLVQPGTYKENLIMWKPVRLQGVGAAAVTINADAHPAGKMDQWRRQINCVFGLDLQGVPNQGDNQSQYDPNGLYTCPASMFQRVDRIPFEAIVGWDASGNGNLAQVLQEPTLMGAYEGAGITVLGRGVRVPNGNPDFWGQNATGGAGAFTDGSRYLTGGNVSALQAALLGYPGTGGNDCAANPSEVDGRDYGTSNFFCNPSRIDGVSVINSSQGGGGVFVHGWAQNLEVANTRISGNQGTLAGAINLGNGETPDAFINDGVECGVAPSVTPCPPINTNPLGVTVANDAAIPFQFNTGVRIHHNMLYDNASIGDALFSGTPSGAGAITVSAGADNYRIDHNWIAGNLSTGDGGGVQHLGMAFNGRIDHNFILYNQSTNPTLPTNGGGIAIEGANLDRTLNGNECGSTNDQDCPPGLTEGIGPGLVIDANLIVGNSAESGSGGGLRIQQINGSADVVAFPKNPSAWYDVTVTNNVIANNVAGYDGGGVSLQDALKVNLVNNTVASNDSTASAGALFKTLGAIMSNTPPPGCTPTTDPSLPQNPNCLVADAPHGPQPAGLVVSAHTVNLTDALVGVITDCSSLSSYGYSGTSNANNDCRKVSKPHMVNNLFWQNRTFSVNVVNQFGNVVTSQTTPTGTGLQSQQNLIALTPQLVQRSTGECSGGANYWDIGLRTDDVNGGMIPPGTRLALINSLYTGDARSATIVSSPVSTSNQTPSDTPLVAPFCNGARMPPEHCTDGGVDNGSPSCKGYNAPAGASETTGLTQVFVFNGIQPTATVDEGHNWLNLSYGPLTLSKPNVGTGTPGEQMLVGGSSGLGTTVGAYAIPSGSAAAGNGVGANGLPATVANDYFGNARATNGTRLDIGAVALTTTAASVRPMALTFGTVAIGSSSTLTVTLQAGGTSVSGLGVSTAGAFSASAASCPATLAPHASCPITVTFSPLAPGGQATGSLTMTASGGGPILGAPVTLTGNGQALAVNATPASVVFLDTIEGQTRVQAVTLKNLSGSAVSGLTGAVHGTGFSLVGSDCPASLLAGNTCTVNVAFSPLQPGSSSGTLSLATNPTVSTSGPVSLVGNGLPALPVLTLTSPASGIQGSVVPVTLTGQWFTGATQVNVGGNGVAVSGVTVVNDTTITATFTIARTANASTTPRSVTVVSPGGTSNAGGFTVQVPPVAFTTATAPGNLNTTTQTLAFGSANGTVSSTVTVKVNGSAGITFQAASFAAGSNAAFTKGTDTCSGNAVAAGGSCKVTITFAGAGNANRTASLVLPYTGDLGSPLTLAVTGR
jgi:hypothetical protein